MDKPLSEQIRNTKGGVIGKPLLDMWADRAAKLEKELYAIRGECDLALEGCCLYRRVLSLIEGSREVFDVQAYIGIARYELTREARAEIEEASDANGTDH